jgi:hypothetical protein
MGLITLTIWCATALLVATAGAPLVVKLTPVQAPAAPLFMTLGLQAPSAAACMTLFNTATVTDCDRIVSCDQTKQLFFQANEGVCTVTFTQGVPQNCAMALLGGQKAGGVFVAPRFNNGTLMLSTLPGTDGGGVLDFCCANCSADAAHLAPQAKVVGHYATAAECQAEVKLLNSTNCAVRPQCDSDSSIGNDGVLFCLI